MLLLRCSSAKPLTVLVGSAEALCTPVLLLSPRAIRGKSEMETAFAFHLAKRAFEEKSNISSKPSNEALLFLAREMNFASALRKIGAKNARDFVLACGKDMPIAKVKKELGLTSAKRIELPKMGKKKGNYFEAERAVEQMALARIRN